MIESVLELVRSNRGKLLNLSYRLVGLNLDEFKAVMHEVELKGNISRVMLRRNKLSSDAIFVVAEFMKNSTNLTWLDLSGNSFDIRGARALAEAIEVNRTVQILCICSCNLGSHGVRVIVDAMKVSRCIQMLTISGNNMGSDGARAVAELISTNLPIRTLFLSSADIGLDGINAISDAMALNHNLSSLYLYSNHDDASAAAILSMLDKNTTLITLQVSFSSELLRRQLNLKLFINHHLQRVRRAECRYWFGHYIEIHEPGISNIISAYLRR